MNSVCLLLVIICSMLFGANAQDNSKDACQALGKCISDAMAERKRCDMFTALISKEWPPTLNERTRSIAEKVLKAAEFDYEKRALKAACLQDSMGNTTVISCNETKTSDCASLTNAYNAKPKAKRQAAALFTTFEEGKKRKDDAAASLQALKDDMNRANQAYKNASSAASLADKSLRDFVQKQLTDCQGNAGVIEAKCSTMAECCSESWLCDLSYQQTTKFSEYSRLQHDLQLERRSVSCPAPVPVPVPVPVPAPAQAAVNATTG